MNHPQNPGKYDAVLGGTGKAPESLELRAAEVMEELLIRYSHPDPQIRLQVIPQALNYGEEGIDLLLRVFSTDESAEVRHAAYCLLLSKYKKLVEAVKAYQPTTTSNSTLQTFTFQVVTTNHRRQIINRCYANGRYFVEDLGNGVTLEMVEIPGGTFIMGSPKTELERKGCESPQHQVTVPSFFMSKYQLTQEQYQAIIDHNPSCYQGNKRPVETVNWDDAVNFCQKLSQKTHKTYTLPSEAQWEYACRAGTTTAFYFGESITPDLVNCHGNYPYASAARIRDRRETTDVGTFPPNSFGLYDMHGNVWEWCLDTWHNDYEGAPRDGSAWINDGCLRVVRGGSWYHNAAACRSASRHWNSQDHRSLNYGFRVVCTPKI